MCGDYELPSPDELIFPPLSRCPDCLRTRQIEDRGCPRCKLPAASLGAITKIQNLYRAACCELIASNMADVAAILAAGPRDA